MNTDEALFFLMLERYKHLFHKGSNPLNCRLTINSSIIEERYALRVIQGMDVVGYPQVSENEGDCK
jgi:hypothetical protein